MHGLSEMTAISYFNFTPEMPFFVVLARFGGTKNGTFGARIKILRPLFNSNSQLDTSGTKISPQKVIFGQKIILKKMPYILPFNTKNIRSMFSRLVRDLAQKAKWSKILWRSRIQALPFHFEQLVPKVIWSN